MILELFTIWDNCYYENESRIDFEPPLETNGNIIWLRGSSFIYKMESTKPTSSNFEYIDIEAINNKTNTIEKTKLISSSKAPSRATRKVYSSSTLFSMVRPYLRNIAYVGDRYKDCIASTGFYICTPQPFINEKYLYYLLTSDYVVNSLNNYMKGDNSPSINTGDLENLLFPIPSLEYQHKAVQLIEIISPIIEKITNENDRLTTLINQTKLRILESIFGENSSYKSYYEKQYELGYILKYEQPGPYIVKTTSYSDEYSIPVLTPGKSFILGYTNETEGVYHVDDKVIIFDDFTTDSRLIDFDFKVKSSAMKILKVTNEDLFNIEYIFYLLQTVNIDNETHKRYWISEYKPLILKIHDFETQIKIVKIIQESFKMLDSLI